ncbi:MAG: hypothetical protein IJU21_01755 [Bacteroidales bacterium]|nr:hypothetical protein [Bacteroidales bacterium]
MYDYRITILFCSLAAYFTGKAKDAGIATFWWIGLSEGEDRSVPRWSMTRTKDAILNH